MKITSYFGLKPCCDCGRTGNYTVNKNGYQFTVCSDCVQNYSDEEEPEEVLAYITKHITDLTGMGGF